MKVLSGKDQTQGICTGVGKKEMKEKLSNTANSHPFLGIHGIVLTP